MYPAGSFQDNNNGTEEKEDHSGNQDDGRSSGAEKDQYGAKEAQGVAESGSAITGDWEVGGCLHLWSVFARWILSYDA